MLRQEMMQSGEALEIEKFACVEIQTGSDIAYATSMASALSPPLKPQEQKPDDCKDGERESEPRQETGDQKNAPTIRDECVKEGSDEKRVLVEGELLLHVYQTRPQSERFGSSESASDSRARGRCDTSTWCSH